MALTYYVSPTGSDLADGLTSLSALATGTRAAALYNGLSAAVQAQGVTVLWDNGIYYESLLDFSPKAGSNGGILTLMPRNPRLGGPASSGMPVKIVCTTDLGLGIPGVYCNNTASRTQNISNTTVSGVVVWGLDVTDGTAGKGLIGGVGVGVPNGTATQCFLHDIGTGLPAGSTGGAIVDEATGDGTNSSGFVASRNLILNIGPAGGGGLYHGIYPGSPFASVVNNVIGNIPGGWAIHAYAGTTQATIQNNTCFNYGTGGIVWGSASIASVHNHVYNNICHGNGNAGTIGLESQFAAPGSVDFSDVENNVCWQNATSNAPVFNDATTHTTVGNLAADPLFVAYAADGSGNYHLQATSPARDSGNNLGPAPTLDYDGTPRPLGLGYDAGAFEFWPGSAPAGVSNMGFIELAQAPQIPTGAAPTLSGFNANLANESVVGDGGRGYFQFDTGATAIGAGNRLFLVTFATPYASPPTVVLANETGFVKTTATFNPDAVTTTGFYVANKDGLPINTTQIKVGYLVLP